MRNPACLLWILRSLSRRAEAWFSQQRSRANLVYRRRVLSVDEAIARVLATCRATEVEYTPLHECVGKHLAANIVAPYSLPEFSNSAMDGYAVLASDLSPASAENEVSLRLVGESRAGTLPPPLAPSTTMRIFTGAALPDGADAIVMQENVRVHDGMVTFASTVSTGSWVRSLGSDVQQGEIVLKAGTSLFAGEIGMLASLGISRVPTHKRPRVAILSTGDELREVESERRPGTVVNSNAYALAALVREAGAEPWVLSRVGDDVDAIAEQIRLGLTADLMLSSGGVSVGDYDLVQAAYKKAHVALDFWRVAMKPGKPLMLGKSSDGRVPVLGLPGNPASAMVTFEIFARPAIQIMLGSTAPFRPRVKVELSQAHAHAEGRVEFGRAALTATPTGWTAHLHPNQGSGALSSMPQTQALVILPADRADFPAGTVLDALLLRTPNSPLF